MSYKKSTLLMRMIFSSFLGGWLCDLKEQDYQNIEDDEIVGTCSPIGFSAYLLCILGWVMQNVCISLAYLCIENCALKFTTSLKQVIYSIAILIMSLRSVCACSNQP